jgi:hypothetical protein
MTGRYDLQRIPKSKITAGFTNTSNSYLVILGQDLTAVTSSQMIRVVTPNGLNTDGQEVGDAGGQTLNQSYSGGTGTTTNLNGSTLAPIAGGFPVNYWSKRWLIPPGWIFFGVSETLAIVCKDLDDAVILL